MKKSRILSITTIIITFVLFALILTFVVGISAGRKGSFYNKGHNAIWIGHEWVKEEKSLQEVQSLVRDFKTYQIDTVFVHTGPIGPDGKIEPEVFEQAVNFLTNARKFDENIKYQAWLGQIRSKLNLDDPEIRKNTANLCTIMSMTGYDGVHFDIEPVSDDDIAFIELLKECREAYPQDFTISVALAEFIPQSFLWFTADVLNLENVNSEINYENVAQYADQLIVMTYDTGIKKEWKYKWLIKEEIIRLTTLLPDKEVFIGIPSYEDDKVGFDPDVENVRTGVSGIIMGLNDIRSNKESFAGIAIYPYWEMDGSEWYTFENLWLK